MIRLLTAFLLAVTIVSQWSCSKSNKPDLVESDRGYAIYYLDGFFVKLDVPAEDIWWTVLEVLDAYGWPVESAIEDAGTIQTETITMGTNRDRYACREWPGSAARVDQLRAKLGIQISVSEDDGTTTLAITADVEGRYVTGIAVTEERIAGWYPCVSTGEIEGEVFDAVLGRLEPLWFDNAIYRRGAPRR